MQRNQSSEGIHDTMTIIDPENSLITLAIELLRNPPAQLSPEDGLAAREARRLAAVEQLTNEISTNPTASVCAAHLIVEIALQASNDQLK